MTARRISRGVALSASAVVLVSLLSTPARPEPADLTLAGTTVVSAPDSSSLVVHVPRDVPYSLDGPTALISLSGEGRVVAATLQPTSSQEISEAIVAGQFNGCATSGCVRAAGQTIFHYSRPASGARRAPDGRPLLPAGPHRLTVLTDGHPVEVRLRLEGLHGTASANTTTPAQGGVTHAVQVLAVPGSPVAWAGSADMTFASKNSLLLAYLQQSSPTGALAGVAGVCHFTGSTRPLLGVPAPGCPFQPNGGDGQARVGSIATEALTLGSASQARMATALTPTTGAQQVGLWSIRVAVTTTPLAFFAWLRLS